MKLKETESTNERANTWVLFHRNGGDSNGFDIQRRNINDEYRGSLLTYEDASGFGNFK